FLGSAMANSGVVPRIADISNSLLKFRSIEFLAEALNLWRTTMVSNTSSAVRSPRTGVGRQFTLNAKANGVSHPTGSPQPGRRREALHRATRQSARGRLR